MPNQPDFLSAALAYAEQGYAVFPCKSNDKRPATAHGFHDATTDRDQIEAWWQQNPAYNIGVPTYGLLVIDVDGTSNPWKPAEPLVGCPVSITPRGGRHYLFAQNGTEIGNSASLIAPQVDIRANGGYVVVPPSTIHDRCYEWAGGTDLPDRGDLPVAPQWVIHLITKKTKTVKVSLGSEDLNQIPKGRRNHTLTSIGGYLRRGAAGIEEIEAFLQIANAKRCDVPLPRAEVARIAASLERYEPDQLTQAGVEGWVDVYLKDAQDAVANERPVDPGPLPDHLLTAPGLIEQIMDFCLDTAPYPSRVLALGGALAFMSLITARKVCDESGFRPNLYILCLAYSGAGKDWPRKINRSIAAHAGISHLIGDRFASGEGLQDVMKAQPAMLFQVDEFDGLLESVNKSRDARFESIVSTLLNMFSTSDSLYALRAKAGCEGSGTINQPSLSVMGSAIPNNYYGALSAKLLINGFFSRTLVFETSVRSRGRMAGDVSKIPPSIATAVNRWVAFSPGGNLADINPFPLRIMYTQDGREAIDAARSLADDEGIKGDTNGDPVSTAIWSRATELTSKLALLYSCSKEFKNPRITKEAVEWGRTIVFHQVQRQLFQASRHVSETKVDGQIKRLCCIIEKWGDNATRGNVLRDMKCSKAELEPLLATATEAGYIQSNIVPTKGRKKTLYSLTPGVLQSVTSDNT